MAAVRRQIVIEQGANFAFSFVVLDAACEPRDLTGWKGRMQIRETHDAPAALIDLDDVNGGVSVNAATGRVSVTATAAQTQTLSAPSAFVYDIVGTASTGEVDRWVEGVARISPGVTR
jgi:hypothetical protein